MILEPGEAFWVPILGSLSPFPRRQSPWTPSIRPHPHTLLSPLTAPYLTLRQGNQQPPLHSTDGHGNHQWPSRSTPGPGWSQQGSATCQQTQLAWRLVKDTDPWGLVLTLLNQKKLQLEPRNLHFNKWDSKTLNCSHCAEVWHSLKGLRTPVFFFSFPQLALAIYLPLLPSTHKWQTSSCLSTLEDLEKINSVWCVKSLELLMGSNDVNQNISPCKIIKYSFRSESESYP